MPEANRIRVFLSSTTIDFQDVRENIAKQLRVMEYEPVYMGDYTAAAVPPLEKVLRDVASCDVYVGLFAHWYGTPIESIGKSHTHMEYCEAKRLNKPRLIFLLHEDVDVWPLKWCDMGARGALMQDLRSELLRQQSHTLHLFRDFSGLTIKVTEAIKDWVRDQSQIGLVRLPAETLSAPPPEPPGQTIVGLRFQDIRSFRDRQSELAQLQNLLTDDSTKLISIVGRSGTGKTALLSRLGETIEQQGLRIPDGDTAVSGIVYFPCRRAGGTVTERLWYEVSQLLPASGRGHLQKTWTEAAYTDEEKFLELAGKFQNGSYLVFMDGFESVLGSDGIAESGLRTFFEVLLRTRHSLRFVLSTEANPEFSPELRHFCKQVSLEKGLPPDDAVALLRGFDPDGHLELETVSDELLYEVVKRCDGLPRMLLTVIGILSNDETLSIERMLNERAIWTQLIEQQYQRFTSDRRRILEVLAVFDRPVPRQAIEGVIRGLDSPAGDPFSGQSAESVGLNVKQCLSDLVRGQIVTASRQRGTYELQARMQEYAYQRIPEASQGFCRQRCHQLTADYYHGLRTPPEKWRGIEDVQPQLEEFDHRIRGGQYDAAATVLESIDEEFLQLQGRYQQLVLMHQQLVGRLTTQPQACKNLGNLALSCRRLGRLTEAVTYFQQAIAQAEGDSISTADWLTELGNTFADAIEMDSAFSSYESAIEIASQQNYLAGEARALGNLAIAHRQLGRIEDAILYYDRAIKIDQRRLEVAVNDDENRTARRWYATHVGNRGKALLELGRITEGSACLDDAVQICQSIPYPYAVAVFQQHRAEAVLLSHNAAEAVEICESVVRQLSEFGASRNLSYALLILAEAECLIEKWEQARQTCQRGCDLRNPETVFWLLTLSGILALRTGDRSEGESLLEEAIRSCDQLIARSPHFYEASYCKSLAELAAGRAAAAVSSLQLALAKCSAAGVLHAALDKFTLLSRAVPETPGLKEVRDLLERDLPCLV